MSLPDLQSTKPIDHAQHCYTCNSPTHLQAHCPKAPCFQCKGSLPKHLTTNCPQKKKKKYPKPYEKFKAMCTKCRLPLKYDHVAWARGLSDSVTTLTDSVFTDLISNSHWASFQVRSFYQTIRMLWYNQSIVLSRANVLVYQECLCIQTKTS